MKNELNLITKNELITMLLAEEAEVRRLNAHIKTLTTQLAEAREAGGPSPS